MKKNMWCLVALLPVIFALGCGAQPDMLSQVKDNMSEASDVYFASENDKLPITISSGRREEPYAYDGVSRPKCNFALVIASLDSCESEMITISINGSSEDVILEYNYRTGTHLADLERRLSGDEEIEIKYVNEVAKMNCKSKQFNVSADEAVAIGSEKLADFIKPLCGKEFAGECYLKILDNISGGFNEVFWLFSVLNSEGEMRNVIISTQNGAVLAGGEQNVI